MRIDKVAGAALLLALGASSSGFAQETAASRPPKVILIIGDGMDQNQITIARNYLVGLNGRLTLDTMPVRSAAQVQTVTEHDPSLPEYVADSANTATSMATGIVTSSGRIGTTAGTDQDAPTIMELAADAGFGTAIVTTASVTDATPASFVAHVAFRLCEAPSGMVREQEGGGYAGDCPADLKANGGKGSIAEQIAASRVDIVLGGGQRNFAQRAEGERRNKSVLDLAVDNGFHVVTTAAELESLPASGKVLGLFAPGTLPVMWRGAGGAQAELVAHDETGRVVWPQPFPCEPSPNFGATPTLQTLAAAALKRLDEQKSFVLMIESASIDKQSHVRRPCGSIGELKQLDETLAFVLEYARSHPETLVLVTADHAQAALLVSETSVLAGLNAASPGHFARVLTPEGAVMGVNYATNDSNVQEEHTGADVPLYAFGAGADEIPAWIRQAEIFDIMVRHLKLAKVAR